jgi:hypothetical protein
MKLKVRKPPLTRTRLLYRVVQMCVFYRETDREVPGRILKFWLKRRQGL